jgi:hypothetical protein
VPAAQLGFYDRDLTYVIEPGRIDVFVGTSSSDLLDVGFVTVQVPSGAQPPKAFDGSVSVS